MKAVTIEVTGGPEVLKYADLDTPEPGAKEVLIRVAKIGVNFVDTYMRSGLYKVALPAVLGKEGSGVVSAIGSDVTEVAVGDRVGFANVAGTYAEFCRVPVSQVIRLPQGITDEAAAASLLQGMTAHFLSHSTFPLSQQHTCLVHAAAGGVGLLLVQMAKKRGAKVIASVGSEKKAQLAIAAGADEVVVRTGATFPVPPKSVDVVYDSIGKDTFAQSLTCVRPRGMLVCYGNASGPVAPFSPLQLSEQGSVYLTRPSLAHYVSSREELEWRAGDVLGWIAAGELSVRIHNVYPLQDAHLAHQDLQAGGTSGKLLLTPQ